jgi:hypothetical protein
MSVINPTANRYPIKHPDPVINQGFTVMQNGILDLNQAVVALTSKVNENTTNITNISTTQIAATTGTTTGSQFPVNVNQQAADYIIQQSDAGGVVVFSGTGPYTATLNNGVNRPFYTAILNMSSAVITAATTGSFLVNNLASVTIPVGQWAFFYFDGVNWWALYLQPFPVTIAPVSHLFITGYSAVTGLFTVAQPTYADIVYGFNTTVNRPGTPTSGMMFFDSTLGIPIWWDSTQWVDATGAAV